MKSFVSQEIETLNNKKNDVKIFFIYFFKIKVIIIIRHNIDKVYIPTSFVLVEYFKALLIVCLKKN